MGKKKSMLDLMEQIENDPRFNAAIVSLHNSESSCSSARAGASVQMEDGPSVRHANVIASLRQKPSQVDSDGQEDDRLIKESTNQWSNSNASPPSGHPDTTTGSTTVLTTVNPTVNPDDKLTQNILPRLTWRQDTILRILHDQYMEASRRGIVPYCNREDLAEISGWSTGSIHAALRGLKQKQYFKTQAKPIRISNYTAFIFEINQDLCQKYFTLYPQADDNPCLKSMVNPMVKATVNPTVNPTVKADLPYS